MNARRLALLGLDAPLSPIMLAVLGLWPEESVEPLPVYQPMPSGPDAPSPSYSRERDEEEDRLDRALRQTRELEQRADRHKMMLLALSVAALEYA